MGSYLRKLAPGMSDENLERFATTLLNTADIILKRWDYDALVKDSQIEEEIPDKAIVYKAGTSGRIVARIRPPGPKVTEVSVEELIAAMGKDGKIPLYMMDALSEKWKGKDLAGMRNQLREFRNELETDLLIKKAVNRNSEEKSKIVLAPEMPPLGERNEIPYNWTVFGFMPRSRKVMREHIEKVTEGVPFKTLGSKRAIVYNYKVGNIGGRVVPKQKLTK